MLIFKTKFSYIKFLYIQAAMGDSILFYAG